MNNRALIIGGGGTIGTYVKEELLKKGCYVDIICLEDLKSDNEKLRYFKANATLDYLKGFLEDKHYDSILNLLHHPLPEEYIQYHTVIAPKTDQEIFVSSIRAVGDAQHPITSSAPTLLDLAESGEFTDADFIRRDDYSMPKARCERYLKYVSKEKNWTIVRPMINSSDKRFDLIMHTFDQLIELAKTGEPAKQPDLCRYNVAGIEWAGNTGKMIANLMFKPECLEKTYMLSTAHRMTWDDIAEMYKRLLGVKVEWMDMESYKNIRGYIGFPVSYDRGYNRDVDNTELLKATGLKPEDFKPFEEAIVEELKKVGAIS